MARHKPNSAIPIPDVSRGVPPAAEAAGVVAWSGTKRFWVSVALLLHLACVIIAPMAVVDPRSDIASLLHQPVSPWTRGLFLDHGYRFFAPEPGPSHIVEYEVFRADGSSVKGHFPDRDQHWPRLLYHRWFMLSETVFQHASMTLDEKQLKEWESEVQSEIKSLVDSDDVRNADRVQFDYQRAMQDHQRAQSLLRQLVQQIKQDLLKRHNGVSIKMRLATRVIPSLYDVARGRKLDDPRYLPDEAAIELGEGSRVTPEVEAIAPLEPVPSAAASGGGE